MNSMSWEQSVQWLRERVDQQELVKACYFDDPLLEAAERYWKSEEWKLIAAFLPSTIRGNLVLDLGAGRGISSYALAKDGWQVTALEPDHSDIVGAGAIRELARQSGLPIEVVTEYSEKLPFPDNSFELVNCRQVLHHARDLSQTCHEIFRVLKPGGKMIATREHVISNKNDLQVFLDSHPLHKFYGGENAFLLEDYLSAIRGAGLKVKNVLAPYDSIVNYFPMTDEQVFSRCANKVIKYFGYSISKIILNQNHLLGKWLMRRLVNVANCDDHTPGRLYSFLAVK